MEVEYDPNRGRNSNKMSRSKDTATPHTATEDIDDYDATEKLHAPADWDGPVEDRRCTDILVLLLLWGSWIAMTGVGAYAITEGDYRKVLFPLDYDGNICGTDFGPVE